MIAFLAVALALLAPPGPVPPPQPREAADCAAQADAADQLVCTDNQLIALAARVRNAASPAGTAYIEGAAAWFARSRLCAAEKEPRGCLVQAYTDRLAVIEASLWGSPTTVAGLKCDRDWRGKALTGAPPEVNRMLVVREGEAILAIASPAAAGPWKPALQWTRKRDGVVFRTAAGRTIGCRLQTF